MISLQPGKERAFVNVSPTLTVRDVSYFGYKSSVTG